MDSNPFSSENADSLQFRCNSCPRLYLCLQLVTQIKYVLVQLSTCWDVVINHEKVKFFLIAVLLIVYCRKQHTTGLDTHHCSRWKVCDCDQSLSNQLFRLIVSVNTGKDSSVCACSIIQCELKKLLRLRNCLTSLNLNCSEITLAESIEIYCILKERLYSYIAEMILLLGVKKPLLSFACSSLCT